MGLRDLLKKKEDISERGHSDPDAVGRLAAPEFTFIRSDTHSQEIISPPSMPAMPHEQDTDNSGYLSATSPGGSSKPQRRSLDVFRSSSSRNRSTSDVSSASSVGVGSEKRRLSQRLHLSRHPSTSENIPQDLPEIKIPNEADDLEAEVQWEKRATMLARENEKHRSRPASPSRVNPAHAVSAVAVPANIVRLAAGVTDAPKSDGVVSTKETDANIQEAIRLHEEGELEASTRLFGVLADPNGANNPLSQVLYGLALRHGWGCTPDPGKAVTFLTKAASNAAVVENMALLAGQKKGGAAKGELVLAIFELANCFRNGWGIPKDPVAAKHYYETAANLGDTDAMNEVAWCYVEGFGCRKDKYAAARYYRLAEKNGNKTLGNSWIWKEKYDPANASGSGGGKKK